MWLLEIVLCTPTLDKVTLALVLQALQDNTTGTGNVAIGSYDSSGNAPALHNNTTGTQNIAIGVRALTTNTTGYANHAIGNSALAGNSTAINCVAIGQNALSSSNAAGNVAVGHYAGIYITSGEYNTCLGYACGYSNNNGNQLTTGGSNVLIGNAANVPSGATGGSVVIGSGVGKGNSTGFITSSSGVYQGNNSSSWSTTSDRRLKKNIVDSTIGLAEINQIQVRNYEYKTEDDLSEIEADGLCKNDIIEKEGVQVSAIAQELQAILPNCVTEQSTGVLSVNADNLTWHLVKAVQELSAKVESLEAQLNP